MKYEPGTLKVIAFDDEGNSVAEKETHTVGKPYKIIINPDSKKD